MAYMYRKPKMWRTRAIGTTVIGDPPLVFEPQRRRNKSQENARRRRSAPTPAERELERILNSLNGGVLRGRFFREWAFADRWILDFFFHEVRLGIEVDGSVHSLASQKQRDREKERTCDEWSITLLRISNREVFGDRQALVQKLRAAWRLASRRFKQSVYARLVP
jgi:very-short-patch-repair endonuclease